MNKEEIKGSPKETKKFSFWKTFIYIFFATLFLLLIFFWFVGSYEVSGFGDVFMGVALFSIVLAVPFTFFIKWWKEYKLTGKLITEKDRNTNNLGFLTGLFEWNMDEKQLKYQIENYNKAGFFSAPRKLATILMIFFAILNLVFMTVGWVSPLVWIDTVSILTLAFFVYKGSKIAIILAMVYWTFSQGYNFVNRISVAGVGELNIYNVLLHIIWWSVVMALFWQAYQVERERKRLKNNIYERKN